MAFQTECEGDRGIDQTACNMDNNWRPVGCRLSGYRKWDGHRSLNNMLYHNKKGEMDSGGLSALTDLPASGGCERHNHYLTVALL